MPAVIRFDAVVVVVVIIVVIQGLDILCCGHRHLSRCAVASLVAPPPLLWRLTCAGWLSLCQLVS